MSTTRRGFLRDSAILASSVAGGALVPGSAFVCGADPAARKVRVGLVGTAHPHGLGKLSTLLKLSDLYEVVGVFEPDEKRRQSLAKKAEFAAVPLMTEEQLLNVPGLAAVLVESEVNDVIPLATRFAPAALHIHAEKPCGPSLPAFRHLVEIMEQKGRILQTGYMIRRNPAFELCAAAVRDGLLGDIFEIQGIMGKIVDPVERKGLAIFPGGMMFELACHLIDAMVGLLGKPQAVQSYLRVTHPEQDALADNTLAVFEYPKALATIRSSANDVVGFARRSFVASGDAGTISILPMEPPTLTLTLVKAQGAYKKGTQPIELRKSPGRFDDHLTDFARMIRGEKELDVKPQHDLDVLETVLRASGMPTT